MGGCCIMKFVISCFLLLLLCVCGFSNSQSTSSNLPISEEVAYENMREKIYRDLPDVKLACNQSAFLTIKITIKCQQNPINPREFNVISITIQRLNTTTAFPQLSNFTHLQELVVTSNKIEDYIPQFLGTLSQLTKLDLSYNMLQGPIPDNLGKLSKLTSLSLSHNLLYGSIPQSLVNLRSLQTLDLSTNKLSGSIPVFLSKIITLKQLDLGSNNFSGGLLPEIGDLVNLTHLKLPSNNLSGPIPAKYAQLKNLNHFSVAGNLLNGSVPNFIQNWIMLSRLEIMGNKFTGALPEGIFGLTALETLWVSDLQNNGFSLPSLAKLRGIKSLIMRKCGITGPIPEDISTLSRLIHLDLSYNNLTGGVPESLSAVDKLTDMSLAGNKLSDAFPEWVVEDSRKLLVDLSNNNLILNKTLNTQSLSMKNLYGCCSNYTTLSDGSSLKNMTSDPSQHCPPEKPKHNSLYINCGGDQKLERYEADNASSNVYVSSEGKWAYSCSGHFMSSSPNSYSGYFMSSTGLEYTQKTKCAASPLFETARLCPVSLTYYGFCLHKGEYIVQLHFAEVVYNEDSDYGSLKNRLFDVYIQDELKVTDLNIKKSAGAPNRPWNETHRVRVKEDSLLKIQLLWAGKGAITDDPLLNGPLISAITVTPAPKPKKLTPWQIVLIVLASIIFALLLILAFIWKMGWLESKEWLETSIELRDGATITIKQIIVDTQNFTKNEIGRGGFGIVYKVVVHDQIVAVKKLITGQSNTVATELREEVYALKSLEHENLIKFFGSFSRDDLHLLVYEFMENGGLETALSDGNSRIKLNWETRFNICLGIAKGLRYMHEEKAYKIIHRDLKASNILLDAYLKAKISDFGLAKIYDENNCVEIVQGTHGYMAPEYAMRGLFSDKTDVYSYGIMLLEIISGKSNAIDSSSGQRDFLLDRASDLHKRGRLTDLVDKRLKPEFNPKEANTILNLAIVCTNITPASRPKISEVVDVIEGKISVNKLMISPALSSASMCPHCCGTGIHFDTTEKEEKKDVDAETSEDICEEKSPLLS